MINTRNLFLLFLFTLIIAGCTRSENDTNQAVNVEYRLDTKSLTGDHFFVSYVNALFDTLTEHQHPGWDYSFSAAAPFRAYVKAKVIPIDTYVYVLSILVNGKLVEQDSASTASGLPATIELSHLAY